MTSHQLAAELLGLPDVPVRVHLDGSPVEVAGTSLSFHPNAAVQRTREPASRSDRS